MYHNHPKWLPTLLGCVLILAFIICTYFTYNWISALGTYLVCYLLYSYSSQQTLRPHFSRTSCGAAWGIICSIFFGFFKFVRPVLLLKNDINSNTNSIMSTTSITIVFISLWVLTCIYLYLSIVTIPGYVETEFDR